MVPKPAPMATCEGSNAPQAQVTVTTPTFTQSQGSAAIMLPAGWSVDSSGNLTVNGQQPSLSQAEQYANAYAGYLNWYQANPQPKSAAQSSTSTLPPVPNWYNTLSEAPSGGVYAANLAALQYAPLAPTQTQQPGLISEIGSTLAPLGTAIENYEVKPLQQYVVSPAEQAAFYAASRLSPAFFVPGTASSTSFLQGNPLSRNISPSINTLSTLASSLQPYLNTGAQDINNFLSGVQGGINQWAATPYNSRNILSAPYLANDIGSSIKTFEQAGSQLATHPIQAIGAMPGEMAQAQASANQLVKEGYAPWYFPDVTLAMMTAPLDVASLGGGTIAEGLPFLARAGLLTGIGAGANYGINGLLTGQWTGPQAFQNAETGALTAAALAPLTVGSPIADWLASRGVTGIPAQILNNIPVYGSWSALNAGLSSEAQGNVPTPAYLGENFGIGAALGTAMPFIGAGLSNIGFRLPAYVPNEASPDTSARALTFRFFGTDYPLVKDRSEVQEEPHHFQWWEDVSQ